VVYDGGFLCKNRKFIFVALSLYYWEQDPTFKAKLKETAFQKLPYYLDKFEAQVKKNGGYFVGGKVIIFYCVLMLVLLFLSL